MSKENIENADVSPLDSRQVETPTPRKRKEIKVTSGDNGAGDPLSEMSQGRFFQSQQFFDKIMEDPKNQS